MSEEEEPRSIRVLFRTAERAREGLDSYDSTNSDAYQEKLSSAIATYEDCRKLSNQVSLFSSNESLDDVSSSDIQYMTINFHLADLVQKLSSADIRMRRRNLISARSYYERFLTLLDEYDVLSKSDAKLYEQYTEDKENFSTASTTDASRRRDAKIARFKEEKELKKKLEYLKQNPKLAEQDEQVVRQLNLTNLAFMTHQTFQALESLAQELTIISRAPPAPPPESHNAAESNPDDARQNARGNSQDTYSDRLDSRMAGLQLKNGPILDSKGKPLQPFTLLDSRQRLQKGVFRPDHNLPTMSIDEYLAEEKRRGGIIEGGGEQSGIRPEPDEDDLDKADEETMKARAWDEYVEANPKGSGNTLNRG